MKEKIKFDPITHKNLMKMIKYITTDKATKKDADYTVIIYKDEPTKIRKIKATCIAKFK